jgi:hypothetical protein
MSSAACEHDESSDSGTVAPDPLMKLGNAGFAGERAPRLPHGGPTQKARRAAARRALRRRSRWPTVPPILASPPASNLIAFSGNVLTIPD